MATRSAIGIETSSGEVLAIYAHWDGYPSHNGAILNKFYSKREDVLELIAHGNVSILGKDIGWTHNFNEKIPNICTFYRRDRGEDNNGPYNFVTLEDFVNDFPYVGIEYFYFFDRNGVWHVYDCEGNREWIPLSDVLDKMPDADNFAEI